MLCSCLSSSSVLRKNSFLINPSVESKKSMSKMPSVSNEGSVSSSSVRPESASNSNIYTHFQQQSSSQSIQPAAANKKKRNLPGNPDPDAEVIALSPKTLMATNRFVCEICMKGFQRDQNLQLHRRGHNLPWKLKQRSNKEIKKKVYICPELSCVHHDPARALGDLTGIKKHFCRKHGEKKWKCDKCSKKYAVQSDWKAHSKICGTREYRCDCGTLFSRRDSFITHRAFCDALAEETAKGGRAATTPTPSNNNNPPIIQQSTSHISSNYTFAPNQQTHPTFNSVMKEEQNSCFPPWLPSYPQSAQGQFELSPSSAIFSMNQNFSAQAHQADQLTAAASGGGVIGNGNPSTMSNPNIMGPTTLPRYLNPLPNMPTLSHMSATALLQKAAQMGSNMSKTGLSQPAAATISSRGPHEQTHVFADNNFGLNLSSSHDITVSSSSTGFLNSFGFYHHHHLGLPENSSSNSFEDALGGMLNHNNSENDPLSTKSGVADDDNGIRKSASAAVGASTENGLTRDFLGLKALSPCDIILSIDGDCMNNSSTDAASQSQTNQNPSHEDQVWQG